MLGRGPAAAPDDVDHARLGELAHHVRRGLGLLVVAAELVRQPGVGVRAHQRVGNGGELLQVRPHLVGTERTVESDRERVGVAHRVPERSRRLPGQRAPGAIGDRARDHQRHVAPAGAQRSAVGDDRRLRVQRVEDRLDQHDVDAAGDQRLDLLLVRVGERVEGDGAIAGILDARRDRQRHVRRTDRAGDEAPFPVAPLGLVGRLARQHGRGPVELDDQVAELVVGLGDARGAEGVGLDDVGPCQQVAQVDLAHGVWARDREHVVVAHEIAAVVAEPIAAEIVVDQAELLERGAHRAVEHEDALARRRGEGVAGIDRGEWRSRHRSFRRWRVSSALVDGPGSWRFVTFARPMASPRAAVRRAHAGGDRTGSVPEPQRHGETVGRAGRRELPVGDPLQTCVAQPGVDRVRGEPQSAMGVLAAQEVQLVRREVDDEQSAARGDEACRLVHRTRRVVEIVQHLVHDHEIEALGFERRAVDVALAELDSCCSQARHHRRAGWRAPRATSRGWRRPRPHARRDRRAGRSSDRSRCPDHTSPRSCRDRATRRSPPPRLRAVRATPAPRPNSGRCARSSCAPPPCAGL